VAADAAAQRAAVVADVGEEAMRDHLAGVARGDLAQLRLLAQGRQPAARALAVEQAEGGGADLGDVGSRRLQVGVGTGRGGCGAGGRQQGDEAGEQERGEQTASATVHAFRIGGPPSVQHRLAVALDGRGRGLDGPSGRSSDGARGPACAATRARPYRSSTDGM
jgi:hypothetical protein